MLKLRHPISLLLISFLVMLGVLRTYSTPTPVESDAPDVVYAGNKISLDAGLSFTPVDFGTFSGLSPEIVGICRGRRRRQASSRRSSIARQVS